MATMIGKWNIRWNLERLDFTVTLWIKNFAEIALSRKVFEIKAFLYFAIFAKNSKWLPLLAGQNIVEIVLSGTVFEIQAFLYFWKKFKIAAIFGKWNIRWNMKG